MVKIDKFTDFNQKNYLLAQDYVENNFLRLVQHFGLKNKSEDEQKSEMISYFSRFPDQISRFNIQAIGGNRTQPNPIVNNIGGTVKYL